MLNQLSRSGGHTLKASTFLVAALAYAAPANATCASVGLTLPPGFCATVFADRIGHARQLAVAPDGTVFVNTWRRGYYKTNIPDGGFLFALQDTTGRGKANRIARFGPSAAKGGSGGTGIAVYNGKLYVETAGRIVAYAFVGGRMTPAGPAQVIVSGLPIDVGHRMHPFMIDGTGNLYVDVGSATNACQPSDRAVEVPGNDPCTELRTRAGTWRFDANKTDQIFSAKARFATGLRNGEGFAADSTGRLFVTQHGRDQLYELWPKLYTQEQGANLPAEEVVQLVEGADYGWPYCYYDSGQQKLVLAPEYGGDGGHKIGVCAAKVAPVASFPAHWASNALAIYAGDNFPSAYRDALIIAFHGSWNRAPLPQGGYNVVVQPMKNGKADGPYQVLVDGFAGADKSPDGAAHRPTGVAVAPDGALFISDDITGTIWRVTYAGDRSAPVRGVPASRTR